MDKHTKLRLIHYSYTRLLLYVKMNGLCENRKNKWKQLSCSWACLSHPFPILALFCMAGRPTPATGVHWQEIGRWKTDSAKLFKIPLVAYRLSLKKLIPIYNGHNKCRETCPFLSPHANQCFMVHLKRNRSIMETYYCFRLHFFDD